MAFQRLIQAEVFLKQGFLHNGASVVSVPLADRLNADQRSRQANEKNAGDEEVHDRGAADLQETDGDCDKSTAQRQVVCGPIPVELYLETVFFHGNLVEVEELVVVELRHPARPLRELHSTLVKVEDPQKRWRERSRSSSMQFADLSQREELYRLDVIRIEGEGTIVVGGEYPDEFLTPRILHHGNPTDLPEERAFYSELLRQSPSRGRLVRLSREEVGCYRRTPITRVTGASAGELLHQELSA